MSISKYSEEKLNNEKVFVKLYADWCNPCKNYAPIIDKVVEDTGANFMELNIDNNSFAQDHKVKTIPTIIYFENGEEQDRKTGSLPESVLLEWVKSK